MSERAVSSEAIERAVRLSYAQAMLGAIYGASTGGMFLIGYALRLKADNVHIGLMSTIPMLCVVVQLFSALLVERGYSRRKLTIISALLNVVGWIFIILIPYLAKDAKPVVQVGMLIGIISLVTLFGYVSGNARGSWVGDLIPASFRGTFFGRITMYAGIIGLIFGIVEGRFLDYVQSLGIGAFSWLFGFGMIVGLINALLFVPQTDVPVQKSESGGRFLPLARETFANRALMMVLLYALLWSLQTIAGPFVATYMIRDLQMSFFSIGLVNACVTVVLLATSPFWGRIVDRYGCRPVLIYCTAIMTPIPFIWLLIDTKLKAYWLLPPVNLLGGFAVAGISVALNTLVYKVTPTVGRAVQFAIYGILVTLAAAPMPAIGGHVIGWMKALGYTTDLRFVFYLAVPFVLAATIAARYIPEPSSRRTGELARNIPLHLRKPRTLSAGE